MRINRFSYKNKATGWELKEVKFGDFNLLVGASGVGKTQILKAILAVASITQGKFVNGACWMIEFSIDEVSYTWSGEFEDIGIVIDFNSMTRKDMVGDFNNTTPKDNDEDKPKILFEDLLKNNEPIFERTSEETKINGQTLSIKLNKFSSIIILLDDFILIREAFSQILSINMPEMNWTGFSALKFAQFKKELNSLDKIKNSSLPPYLKLALVYENISDLFDEIRTSFIAIFPMVEDIKFDQLQQKGLPPELNSYPFLHLKDNHTWVISNDISEGMLKIMLLLATIYLSPNGSIIVIDEFENSLGVNCINIFDEIRYKSRDLQFIITSHHPYIINNIPMKHWKIVTRKGSVVTVKSAADFEELNPSKIDAFVQLMNLEEYKEGTSA